MPVAGPSFVRCTFGVCIVVVTQGLSGAPVTVAQSVRSVLSARPASYLTVTWTVLVLCGARTPIGQLTSWPATVQAAVLSPEADTNVSPVGSVSMIVDAGEAPSPSLLATRSY